MTCDQAAGPRPRQEPAPARHAAALATLASAAFVYVTAETLPVGLLPQLSAGLHVSDGAVGLLVTAYAAVAGLAALPVTARMSARPRRQVVTGAVALLAVSQLVMAVAPDYAVLLAARLLCALAHGVFWSVLAPVAARLAPPGKAGRATATVFAGNSLALVLGVPLTTALGQLTGWRIAMAVVGAAAVASAAGLRMTMPPLPADQAGAEAWPASMAPALRSRPLAVLCAVTALLVIGHFTAYTYIAALVRRDAGLAGLALSAVLFAYGVAGIGGIALTGWVTDRRPRLAAAACALGLTAALLGLTVLAPGSPVVTVAVVILWGAAFTALPVCLQTGVLRIAPRFADTASALYVVAFQLGIGGGSLAGAMLVDAGLLGDLPAIAGVLAAAGTVVLFTARRAFPPAARLTSPARAARPWRLAGEVLGHPDGARPVLVDRDPDLAEGTAEHVPPMPIGGRLLVQHVLRQGHLGLRDGRRRAGFRARGADVLARRRPSRPGRRLAGAERGLAGALVGQAAAAGHGQVVRGSAAPKRSREHQRRQAGLGPRPVDQPEHLIGRRTHVSRRLSRRGSGAGDEGHQHQGQRQQRPRVPAAAPGPRAGVPGLAGQAGVAVPFQLVARSAPVRHVITSYRRPCPTIRGSSSTAWSAGRPYDTPGPRSPRLSRHPRSPPPRAATSAERPQWRQRSA